MKCPFYFYVCPGLNRFENCWDFHGFGMILWRARENAGSTAMVIENYIHGNVKRVAVGTYKESGCHVFHEKLKLICKAAGRTV